MKNHFKLPLSDLSVDWLNPELEELDKLLKVFRQTPPQRPQKNWLKLLRQGLGISAVGLAEKLKKSRQSVRQFEISEMKGVITLQNMRNIAEALDCRFIYGFVPKHHSSFDEIIAAKTLPLVQNPPLRSDLTPLRRTVEIRHRIKMFLSRPRGRGQIWNLKRASQRPYNWIWADSPMSMQPHGIRRPKKVSRSSK